MMFYGDRVRSLRTNDGLSAIAEALHAGARRSLPIERHAALIEALIAVGEIAQGVADAAFAAAGHDDASDAEHAIMTVVHHLARLAGRSWDGGLQGAPASRTAALAPLLTAAWRLALPDEITIRQPEGFANYAVYPESYWVAAKALAPARHAQVIGIRSIGTSLSAMVASALGADVPLTVRPTGHPYGREIRPGARLDAAFRTGPSVLRAIVDEGPGLSGSSFGAVADALEHRGIMPEMLVFFPSHANLPGNQASARHRARWGRTRRRVVEFDALALHAAVPPQRLEHWVSDIAGAPLAPPLDLSAGRWRLARCGSEEHWPPCDAQNERRKFLLHAERGTFLLKFAGTGESGRRTFARAQALAGAGFSLPPLGLRHGFIVERWQAELSALDPARLDRPRFLRHLGVYIAFRARTFAAAPDSGASVELLFEMMVHNALDAFGDCGGLLARWRPRLSRLDRQVSRIQTDNRLHAWEWLVSAGGRWIKTDAVDHCAGHDLVGCQDAAWDAAGAAAEFEMTPREEGTLLAVLDRETGRSVSRELFRFCKAAYAAFQIGAFRLARDRSENSEARRLNRVADRYAGLLRQETDGLQA